MALKLWKASAQLCDPHPAKIARTNDPQVKLDSEATDQTSTLDNKCSAKTNCTDNVKTSNGSSSSQTRCPNVINKRLDEPPSKFDSEINPLLLFFFIYIIKPTKKMKALQNCSFENMTEGGKTTPR